MDLEESDVQYNGSFSRGFIFELWLSTSGSDTERCHQILQQLIDMVPEADNIDTANLENVIKYICKRITVLWKTAARKKSTVINKHSKWLNKIESVTLPKISILNQNTPHDIPDEPPSSEAATASGRPRKDFAACSKQTQRRRLKMLAQYDESAVRNLKKKSKPAATSEVNPDEVLSLITEAKLTKHQYLLLRRFINSRTNPVLPSYGKLVEAKKQCYPEVVRVTESTAEVELQSLLDHTAAHIVESQKEVLAAIPQESMGDVFLVGKWGFDGSTGHSQYKQNFANSDVTEDGSLFVTSYVPLRLVSTDSSSEVTVLWKNPRLSSTTYCRPIRFQYIKETKDATINEQNYFQEKIRTLVPTKLTYDGDTEINISHCLQLTMVDGKICSALSNTSNAKCYICGALPTQMNVDKPRSGGSGTSNDGNTARNFFKNPAVPAEVTGIQQCLIERCGVLLECMSCGYSINVTKFNEYAIETARQLVKASHGITYPHPCIKCSYMVQ